MMEVSEKEAQLLSYFRSMSEFNRQRILAMAANAADAYLLTMKFKENQRTKQHKD